MSSLVPSPAVQAPMNDGDDLEPRFAVFPKLPLELRLMIWKAALPGPRIITIDASSLLELYVLEEDHSISEEDRRYVHSNAVTPAILFVSRESRTEALSRYQAVFHRYLANPVYIDFGKDTIFFPDVMAMHTFAAGWEMDQIDQFDQFMMDDRKIQHVILGVYCNTMSEYFGWSGEVLSSDEFHSLKSVVLTKDDIFCRMMGTRETLVKEFREAWNIYREREGSSAVKVDITWMDCEYVNALAEASD